MNSISILKDENIDTQGISKSTQIALTPLKTNTTSNPSTISILIVDDNEINLMITEKYLSSFNYHCVSVDNGYDAIEIFKQNEFDAVLMDINMPGINGIETTEKMKLINDITPIIAFTAGSMAEKPEEYTVHGFSDLIIKPVSKEDLGMVIKRNIKYALQLSSIA